MKFKNYLIYGILICISQTIYVNGQIGINTNTPKQLLHIASSSGISTSDVVVTSEGIVSVGNITPTSSSRLQLLGNSLYKGNTTVKQNSLVKGGLITSKLGIGTSSPEKLIDIKTVDNSVGLSINDISAVGGYMLTSDRNGYVYWDAMRPMASIASGSLLEGVPFYVSDSGSENWVTINDDPLVLSPGTWLVMAKSGTYGKTGSFSVYMRLTANKPVSTYTNGSAVSIPALSQISRTTINGEDRPGGISSPEMYVIVVVPTNNNEPGSVEYFTKFYLQVNINVGSAKTMTVSSRGNDTYFRALRIDRP